LTLDPICRKCVNLIYDCPFDYDPWARKHRYDERRWCTVAKAKVNGKERSPEIPVSQISDRSIEAKAMNWQHPILGVEWSMSRKIRYLVSEGYTNTEIVETLGCTDALVYYNRHIMRRREISPVASED